MKKRILIDLLNLATPKIAGVGIYARNLFELWLADRNLPYDVVLYSSEGVDAEKVFHFKASSGIVVRQVGISHVLARFLYQQLVLPFVLRNYDLYYNPTLGLPFLARIIAPKTKLAVTIHDMIPFFYPKKYSPMRSRLVKVMSKQAAKAAHEVITVSQNSKKDIMDIASVPAGKITVVYNFIPPPYELNADQDGKYFLCISTLEPGKNVENAIRGFGAFLRKTSTPYKFFWVGRIGWVYTEEYLKDFVHQEGLDDSFIFKGYLTEEEKKDLLRNCTAIVYLSHYEGFGLPVLEGMTFNKTAVVSNNSSLPEVVGQAGVLCDALDPESVSDAMVEVIEKRQHLIKQIPVQLEEFSAATQIRVFRETVTRLLN